ncbi:T9SS type A sorting domain-containing protein [Nonlabens tegetincola]|uniref:T9SS type A sorting domain-containing protein n=1 Tax=Nonlabens tegetincola TaxID=323273 RepID=UPI000CF4B467|nr:T9SS type A sorting domain-containing protein [Nonlabens tegetincola]PQJ14289.1 hypothetical protein BST93_13680 [Nonlabens tegetincola]
MKTFYILLFTTFICQAQFYGPDDFRISDAGGFGNTTPSVDFPDIAYNSNNHTYLAVWESADTDFNGVVANNSQIIGRFIDLNGNVLGNDILISSLNLGQAPLENRFPRVAFNSSNNTFLVVYQGQLNANKSEIYGVVLDQNGSIISSDYRITNSGSSGNSSIDARTPALVYNSLLNEYFMTYIMVSQATSTANGSLELYGQRLNQNGLQTGTSFPITNSANGIQTNGSIPDVIFNPNAREYAVTYVASPINNQEEAFVTIVSENGNLVNQYRLSNRGSINSNSFGNKWVRAAYSTTDNRYIFVYEADNSRAGEIDVFGVIYDDSMNILVPEFEISQVGAQSTRHFAAAADVDWNPNDNTFYVVFNANPFFSNRFEREIFMRTVTTTGVTGNSLLRVSAAPVNADGSAFLPRIVSNGQAALLIVYKAEDTSSGSMMVNQEYEVYGQLYGSSTLSLDPNQQSQIEFYPNPSKDFIFIEGNGDVEKSVTISSLSGTQLLQHHEINQNLTKIDISNLATGVYFLTVTSNNDIITWKFIKSQ